MIKIVTRIATGCGVFGLIGCGLLDPKTIPPPWKTADIVGMLNIPLPPDGERHTALGDARLAMRMYDAVTAGGAR